MFIIDFFKEIKKMRSKFLVYFMLCLLNLSIWHFLFIKCLGSDFILLEYFTGISYGGGFFVVTHSLIVICLAFLLLVR